MSEAGVQVRRTVVEVLRRGVQRELNADQVLLLSTLGLRGPEEIVTVDLVTCVSGIRRPKLDSAAVPLVNRGLIDRTAGEWKLTTLGERVVAELEGDEGR